MFSHIPSSPHQVILEKCQESQEKCQES
jgi:methyl-accepting chemotaxis protein